MKSKIVSVWTDMKKLLFSLVILFGVFSGPAFAACGEAGSYLTLTQVNALLSGKYVCAQSAALDPPGWNELHTGGGSGNASRNGSIIEQHEGGATTENVGTWVTSAGTSGGRVTYTTGGVTPGYEVAVTGSSCSGSGCTIVPATYAFCGVSGAAVNLRVYITASSVAPPMSACIGTSGNP